ncbi:MAG: radical SAM protein [Candidatus Omnitrophota bacterium]
MKIQVLATPPGGIASISGYLKKRGIKTNLVYYRDERDFDYTQNKIHSFSPKIIGFYSTSSNWKTVKYLSKQIRKQHPKLFQIYGGIHAILAPKTIKKIETLNAICVGYGEEPLLELAGNIDTQKENSEVKGIWLREQIGSDEIIKKSPYFPEKNPDEYLYFDHLIFLKELSRFDNFDYNSYKLEIIFNRGCPFPCTFCCNSKLKEIFNGRTFVPSPKASIDSLVRSLKRTGLKSVEIHDDILTLDKKWFREFISLYKEKIKASFICNLRIGTFNEEDVRLLKEANVSTVWIGIESGNNYIRNQVMKKHISLYQINEAFRWLHKYKIRTIIQNIIGVPYEKPKHFIDTIYLNAQLQPTNYLLSVFYPYPETELYNISIEKGWFKDNSNIKERTEPVLNSSYFPKDQVRFYFNNFRRLVKYQSRRYKNPFFYILPLKHCTSFLIVKITLIFKKICVLKAYLFT